MREFILISNHGQTSGNFNDLMQAGRLDIVIHSIINAFFVSNNMREDTIFHLILNGPPDPPRHIEFIYDSEMPISKKDVGNLLKSVLWKYKQGKKIKAFPGIFVEKKSFQALIKELVESGKKNFYLLDKRGKDISNMELKENPIFILGDHEGIPKNNKTFIKRYTKEVFSLGRTNYFTSQCVTILNYLVDKNGNN
ncbi:MAG: tRNA (pseudouridine(54)-N(1))-methyltransferase TrmY [Candidatus Nanoarchaeia archaeon]